MLFSGAVVGCGGETQSPRGGVADRDKPKEAGQKETDKNTPQGTVDKTTAGDKAAPVKSGSDSTAKSAGDDKNKKPDGKSDNKGTPASGTAKAADPKPGDNPFAPPTDLDADALVQFIVDRLGEPPHIHHKPEFCPGVCAAADRLMELSKDEGHQAFALLAKLRTLHEASCDNHKDADEKLLKLAAELKDDKRAKIAAWVRRVNMEQRLLAAAKLSEKELPAVLDELKKHLAAEKLTNADLRMASVTVDLINRLDKKQHDALFKEFGALYVKSSDGDLANYGSRLGKPAGDASALAGKPLELAGKTTDGDTFAWDDYRGKVVIVDFWATWCGPCRAELPNVRRVHEKLSAKGFDVVGVSLDTDMEILLGFLGENKLPWTTIAGPGTQELASKYGVRGIPTMFLVDREGKVVAQAHNIGQLEAQIEKQLAIPVKEAGEDKK